MAELLAGRRTAAQRRAESQDEGIDLEPLIRSHSLLADLQLTGFEDTATRQLLVADHLMRRSGRLTLRPVLPLLLQLKGKPYRLRNHFPLEPMFRTRMPKRSLLKAGRQISKCVSVYGQQRVLLEDGRRVPGDSLRIGDKILAVDSQFLIKVATVLDTISAPLREVLRITTRTGVELDVAVTHSLLQLDGWTPAEKLRVGDRIAVVQQGGRFGRRRVDPLRIIVTAYLLGDGCTTKSINFSEALEEFQAAVSAIEGKPPAIVAKQRTSAVRVDVSRKPTGVIRRWLESDKLYGKPAWAKTIPGWIFELNRQDTALFISRLWATDGTVKASATTPQITYTSTSRTLVFDLKSLLLKFGIPTTVKRRKAGYHDRNGDYVRCRDAYVLRVETRRGWQRFLDAFSVPGKPGFVLRDVSENNNRDTIPGEVRGLIAEIAESLRYKKHGSLLSAGLRLKPKYPPTRKKLRAYWEHFQQYCPEHPRLPELTRLLEGDVGWDEIESISPLGFQPCWDIEVDGEHNYVLDGVVSHNSTTLAAQGVLFSNCIPYFSTLYLTPLFEMIRRFSQNYVRPFIETSPLVKLFCGTTTTNQILQRSFKNRSQMIFSFAFMDAERTRGIAADKNVVDEIQDMDISFLPVIHETMSGSEDWGLIQYAGTPKTLDNTIEKLWIDTSQAEWIIPCQRGGCNHYNIPALEYDLMDMIGPPHDGIGPNCPGVVCAKCRKPLNPRSGFWEHRFPQRHWDFAGYHLPQIIFPMHYASREKWEALYGKMTGQGNTPIHVFFNEVCGESYDSGSKLVTVTDLKRAAVLPWKNKVEEAKRHIGDYVYRFIGVDWGGGGVSKGKADFKLTSYTTMAVVGMTASGQLHVLYGYRSLHPHDTVLECRMILGLMSSFQASHVVHDYTGAGAKCEVLLNQIGIPVHRIIPVAYEGPARGEIFYEKPGTELQPRDHYRCDKARSLALTCELIKQRAILFYEYDNHGSSDPGLMDDFLRLIEDKAEGSTGRDSYKILRDPSGPDDFAHSVNIAVMALCYTTGRFPDLVRYTGLQLDESVLEAINPASARDWRDL